MLRASSVPNLREINGQTQQKPQWLYMSSENWSAWVIAQRQEYSARLKWEPPTKENGSSSWRSPTASQIGIEAGLLTKSGAPWVGVGRAYRKDGSNKQHSLEMQVLATDGQLEQAANNSSGSHLEKSQLNPRWVETLMGLPIGWVDPFHKGNHLACTNRIDELRLLGNGVVPQTAERAFRVLLNRLL